MKGREIKICFYLSYLLKRKSENNKREKKKRGVTRIKKRVLEYKPTGHRHLQTVEKVQKLEKKNKKKKNLTFSHKTTHPPYCLKDTSPPKQERVSVSV